MKRARLNFAKVPFINLKIPTIILIVLGFFAVSGFLFNLVFATLNGGNYIKQRKILRDQSQKKDDLDKRLKEANKILSTKEVSLLSGEAFFLNDILQQKRFSWVSFLSKLESVKPYKNVFKSIIPKALKDGTYLVNVEGLAQPRSEIFKLEENIFKSDYFGKPHLLYEGLEKTSTWQEFKIVFIYYPEGKK